MIGASPYICETASVPSPLNLTVSTSSPPWVRSISEVDEIPRQTFRPSMALLPFEG